MLDKILMQTAAAGWSDLIEAWGLHPEAGHWALLLQNLRQVFAGAGSVAPHCLDR